MPEATLPAVATNPAVLAALAFVLAVCAQLIAVAAYDRGRRVARLGRAVARGAGPEVSVRRRQGAAASMLGRLRQVAAHTGERVAIVRGADAEKSARLLIAAGFQNRDAILVYAFLKLVLPVAAVIFLALWYLVARPAGLLQPIVVALALTLAASKAPDALRHLLKARRMGSVRRSFPDMLELLVIASEAGLGAIPAMRRVAGELQRSDRDLARELHRTVMEMNLLTNRTDAYANLERRVPLAEVSVFCGTLIQAERYGTPFANALRVLMKDQRARNLLRVEEQAARIPTLMTIPLIFFIMPALFVVLVGPAALNIMDSILNGGLGQ